MTTKKTNKTVSKINEKNSNVDLIENEILNEISNISDENLLEINLDNLNFENIFKDSEKMKKISEKSESTKTTSKKFELYTFKTNKSDRQKLRNELKKFTINIFSIVETKDENKIKSFISDFLEFYKKNYKKNDFSLDSLSYPNRDKDTEERILNFLDLFKNLISK